MCQNKLFSLSLSLSLCFRAIQLVKDYSKKRSAFGKVIQNHSLHTRTVANMEVCQTYLYCNKCVIIIHCL